MNSELTYYDEHCEACSMAGMCDCKRCVKERGRFSYEVLRERESLTTSKQGVKHE